uniref:Ribosomal eL28/Mak16 domain-containing protein n=1 Tax=Brassica campestris TaxID=3711 RepID=M4CBG8_BRACM
MRAKKRVCTEQSGGDGEDSNDLSPLDTNLSCFTNTPILLYQGTSLLLSSIPPLSSSSTCEEIEMATVPGQLVWEIVKRNNCFLVKQFGRGNAKVQFSKESNNLCNLNSYKHSNDIYSGL